MSSCDPHVYQPVDPGHRDMLMLELQNTGATVTGSNPYDINTNKSGVKLHAEYDEGSQKLTVSISDKPSIPLVDVCSKVWASVDPAVQKVLSTPIVKNSGADPTSAGALGKIALNTQGRFTPGNKTAFTDGFLELDRLGTKGEISKAEATKKAGSPVASAGGAMGWITAHPAVAIAAVAALAIGGYYIVKRS